MNPMLAETYEHAGVKVAIHQEEDSSMFNPREWSNVGVMFCWHPDYELGDEQFGRPRDELQFHRMEDAAKYLREERNALVILPLFLYDHSGITIKAGEPIIGDPDSNQAQERMKTRGQNPWDHQGWDTTMVGFIYTNQEKLDEIGVDPAQAIKALRQEVETYDQYLTGDVYFYVVGEDTPFEDSLSGLFGYEYAKEEANGAAELIAEKLERESEQAAEWAARDVVTVDTT